MSLEQTIRDTVMLESMDMDARLQQLVRAGLMPQNTLPLLRKSIAKVQGGMSLQGPERDVMATFINSMMYIVLGDDAIFNKARAGAKTYATEAKEKQEYDYEGDMAMSQLKSIIANSQRMHDSMSEDTNLPEWVQSKITLAEDYISTAANYLQGEVSEAVGDITVKKISAADAYKKHTGQMTKKSKVPVDPKTGKTLYQKVTSEETEDDMVKRLKSNMKKRDAYLKSKHDGLAKIGSENKKEKEDHVDMKSVREESEQIDELSRATVGRYAMKAKSIADNEGGKDRTKGRELAGRKRWGGTMSGVKKAKVMATEESEQIDEISKAMAGRYINKAKNSIDLTAWRQGYKEAGTGSPSKHMEKKLSKRHKGIETAVKKLTKEESENLDELSKKTLGSYINKAATKMGSQGVTAGLKIAADEKSSKNFKDMGKRQKGISRAVNKLTKEDIDAVKQMNESYKTAFDTALTEYGIKSPSELDESKRKEFFNYVDQEFKKGDK